MLIFRIPESIVAVAQELASSLAQWCEEGRGQALEAHEAAVLRGVRGVVGRLLGAVLAETTPGLNRRARWGKVACPECGQSTAPGSWRERTLVTRCGVVTVPTLRCQCGRCRRGWSGLETTLGVQPRARMSAGLTGWVARVGGLTDFREATELLAEYTGVELGAETVRRHSEQVGTALADAEDTALAEVERTREAAGPVDPAPGVLVVELDGVMARYLDGWHEVKVGAVGGVLDGTTTALSYVAAREGADRVGRRLVAEAARRGALEIVDYYHASQHLWDVARALYPDDPAAVAAWARPLARRLRDAGVDPILDALATATAPSGTPAADTLRRERAFFRANAARMAYPTFRAQGFPIGSGAVESAARHVIQLRMKRPGMRWADAGGRAIAALRATIRSHRPLVA